MHTFTRNPWIAVLGLVLISTGGISLARPSPRGAAQGNQVMTEEERRKALERLLQEMQKNQAGQPQQQQQQPAPQAQTPTPAIVQRPGLSGNQFRFDFDGADLYMFITQVADILKITPIIIDPTVKGTVTIHASAAISPQDIFPIFNLILKNNNAALVESDGIYQIVPISDGLRQGLKVVVDLPPAPPEKPAADEESIKKQEGGAEAAPPDAGARPPAAKTTPPAGKKPPETVTADQAGTAAAQAAKTPPSQGGAAAAQIAKPAPAQKAPTAPQPTTPQAPELATHVIRVEFVPVASLIEPLKLFMTQGGVIMPYERLNMLIVTDYSDSIAKSLEIIHLLDNSYLDPDLIELVEIKYNASADVLADLQKVFGADKDGATGVYMVSLDRINAIMLMANSHRALEEAKRWITRLDTTAGRSVQTFIYTVENGTASNIAAVLSLLFGGTDAGSTMAGSQQTGAAGYTGVTGQTGTRGGTGFGGTSGIGGSSRGLSTTGGSSMFGGSSQGIGGQYGLGAGMLGGQTVGGPRLNQGAGMSAQVLNGGAFSGLQGTVRIVADDINNSLIVQGSSADYAYLLDTIKRMDVLPRQAIIDSRIFEIDLTNDLSFGVSATLQGRTTDPHLTTGAIDQVTGALSASTFAFVGNAREILMGLDALRQKTKVKILEAPSVLALDGTPARINVGGSVPVPQGSYVPPTGGSTTSVAYRDTGTSLWITPRISASGTVTLGIYHELSAQGAQTALGPTFTQTQVETTLAVKDGESVAIAGLIREADSNARSGVPFLSEIPVLGSLFGRTTRSSARTEILIMITPHVIRTPERFDELTEEIKNSLRNVRKFYEDKQKENMEELEKARREEIERQQKLEKKTEPPPPIKK